MATVRARDADGCGCPAERRSALRLAACANLEVLFSAIAPAIAGPGAHARTHARAALPQPGLVWLAHPTRRTRVCDARARQAPEGGILASVKRTPDMRQCPADSYPCLHPPLEDLNLPLDLLPSDSPLPLPPSLHIPFPQQARVGQRSSAATASGKENNATASQQEEQILLAALEMAENRHPNNVSACSSTALAARATYCTHTNTSAHNQTLAHSITHSPGSYADSWQLGAKTADECHMDKSNMRSHALIAPEEGGGGGGSGEGTAYVPCKHARWQQPTHAQGHTPASTHIIHTPSSRDLMKRRGLRKPLEPLECLHHHATLPPPPPGLQIAESFAIKEIGGCGGGGGGEGGKGGEGGGGAEGGGGGIRVGNGDETGKVSPVSADGESKATDAQPPPPHPAWPQHSAPLSLHREPLSATPAPLPPPPVPPPGSPASSSSSVLSRSLPKPYTLSPKP